MPEVATPNQAEREFETGTDEFFKSHSQLTATNAKRTYDAYQHAEMTAIHNNQRVFEQSTAQLLTQLAQVNQISIQHLQNAVQAAQQVTQNALTAANAQASLSMVNTDLSTKQYLKHSDLAADSYWNPVSAGAGMNLTAGATPANRATDVAAASTGVAAAGTAVSAEAVSAAVAKTVDATITPMLAILQQLVQGVAAMNASMANVIAQTQPKAEAVSK